ncbi:hypothetical protein DFJ58DRAFT_841470 [Suillus subalutaceus]|uniref:uncharacterized protein n=1 Tax=Suillus subalutaceus TaxID=48586 RepID=UPI001B8783CB|nr:uncharacterized protein DFJ58DRAFT_841470 [Suillus subalutaceus]KAG1854205.1 hypothetical protein DFJ58DRAFT_841470 [Suillus subalutaceus]
MQWIWLKIDSWRGRSGELASKLSMGRRKVWKYDNEETTQSAVACPVTLAFALVNVKRWPIGELFWHTHAKVETRLSGRSNGARLRTSRSKCIDWDELPIHLNQSMDLGKYTF